MNKQRISIAFERIDHEVLSLDDLKAAGVSAATVRAAVSRGSLREGLCGYWLPREADPGAVMVMRSALSDRDYSAEVA